MFFAVVAALFALLVFSGLAFLAYRIYQNKVGQKAKNVVHGRSISSVRFPGADASGRTGASSSTSAKAADGLKGRFLAFGVLLSLVFGSLVTKLWSLQILQGEEFSKAANKNTFTTVKTPAPRGVIYDRNGTALVTNRSVLTVLVDSEVVKDYNTMMRLSVLLGLPIPILRARANDTSQGVQSQRIVASDVDLQVSAYIAEHPDAFPGVVVQTRTARIYPYGSLASHLVGYTGAITDEDVKSLKEGQELEMGDEVGRFGAESSFEALLAGDHGRRRLVADANGRVRQVVSEAEPSKGNDVYLTIDAGVQAIAERALASQIRNSSGTAGSVVAMDATNGEIIALANYPNFEPERFIGGISEDLWKSLSSESSRYPLLNRAIAGAYPAASTFKAFSGLAGLEYGFANDSKTWNCTGKWTGFGERFPQNCWLLSGHGTLGFRRGIVVSCDVVFYEIAKQFWENREKLGVNAMQDYIKQFGFSKKTGIDLSGEVEGRVPTPEWKAQQFRDAPEQASWRGGDMTNMAIGQGYVLITPIQLAVAYGAVATGVMMRPHVFKECKNSEGKTVLEAKTEELGRPQVSAEHYAMLRDALKGVVNEEDKVATSFRGVSVTCAGKTGTAEVAGKEDYGLFACFAPYENPRFVVACVIEEGVSGSASAAPVSAQVIDACIKAFSDDQATRASVAIAKA